MALKKKFTPFTPRILGQLLVDTLVISAALILAFLIRFDLNVPPRYLLLFQSSILLIVGVKIAIFISSGLYSKWWRYTSISDALILFRAALLGSMAAAIGVYFYIPHIRFPRSILIIDLLLTLFFVAGLRFLARSIYQRPQESAVREKPVLVVGAGDAGELILREMLKNPSLGHKPVGLIDDDPRKTGISIHGVNVLGTTKDLIRAIEHLEIEEVIIAMPTAPGSVIKDVVYQCEKAGVVCKTLPGVYELIKGTVNINQLREVQVEDILGRDAIQVDLKQISGYLKGRRILVTGAGGSIGSELCRQISRNGPELLILLDHAEDNLFAIEREFTGLGFASFVPVVADVKCEERVVEIFDLYKPDVVFHSAAYKHVPLMQHNPTEAIRNNTIASKCIAEISLKFAVDRFVMISTDKAVNPATLMGASKALAERIIESYSRAGGKTKFMIVRFGNVLDSSGSVVPIFKRQIASGGPVTVTHPEMTRYFMTIPEAVQLVIQAGALGDGGEIFVLDMGKPIKIVDLAKNMIELSGHDPDAEIGIEFIGIRPGEKLHEELFNDDEEILKTSHANINIARRRAVEPSQILLDLAGLEKMLFNSEKEALFGVLMDLISSYKESNAMPGEVKIH